MAPSRDGGPVWELRRKSWPVVPQPFTRVSPWGLAVAPASFGSHANHLLVGNFGSGTIMTFDAHGKFKGLLQGTGDCPIMIDRLWGLTFGADGGVSGVSTDLYFSAGPNGYRHGLFGVIQTVQDQDNSSDRD